MANMASCVDLNTAIGCKDSNKGTNLNGTGHKQTINQGNGNVENVEL